MRTRTLMALWAAIAMVMMAVLPNTAQADDGKAALKFVPSDAAVATAFNVSRLKTSPLYKEVMTLLSANSDFKEAMDKLKTEAGFDPTTDLESVTIGVPSDVQKTENFIIIAKGNFDEAKIAAAMQKEKGADGKPSTTKETYNGVNMYIIKDEGAVVFMAPHAMIGSVAMIKKAVDASKSGKTAGNSGALASLIKSNDTGKDMWLSMQLTKDFKAAMGGGDPMLADLQAVQASLDVKSGLGLNVTIKTSKAVTAGQIVSIAQLQLGQAGNMPDVKKLGLDVVLSKLKIAADGNDVKISLKLTDAEFKDVYTKVKAAIAK